LPIRNGSGIEPQSAWVGVSSVSHQKDPPGHVPEYTFLRKLVDGITNQRFVGDGSWHGWQRDWHQDWSIT